MFHVKVLLFNYKWQTLIHLILSGLTFCYFLELKLIIKLYLFCIALCLTVASMDSGLHYIQKTQNTQKTSSSLTENLDNLENLDNPDNLDNSNGKPSLGCLSFIGCLGFLGCLGCLGRLSRLSGFSRFGKGYCPKLDCSPLGHIIPSPYVLYTDGAI